MARTQLTKTTRARVPDVDELIKEGRAQIEQQAEASSEYRKSGLPSDFMTSGLAGAGAGFVFGPIGGAIAIGINQILQKRRRTAIERAAMADAETGASLVDSGEKAVAALESAATNDQEKFEAGLVREQFNQARTLAMHPDPQISSQGFSALLNIPGLVDDEADEIEAAAIQREEVGRQQFADEITRADGIRDDVQREGQSFGIRQDAYERMLAVDDSAAGDQVLLVNAFKMVDPNSAVLPGEAATAANTAGIPDVLVTAYNRALRSGERLDPEQRADLIRQAGLQYAVARSDQIDRNTAAIDRARAQGVRSELLQQITLPVKDQDQLPFPAARQSVAGARSLEGPVSGQPVTAPEDGSINRLRQTGLLINATDVRGLGVLPGPVQRIVDDLPRDARVIVDRKTGDLVVSQTGKPSSALGLDQGARNAILGTLPSEDELAAAQPETPEDELLRRTPTRRIARPTND